MNKIKLTKIKNNWFEGKVDDYDFEAKVLKHSIYGIDDSNISKLFILDNDDWLVAYDRHWVVEPNSKTLSHYNAVVDYLDGIKHFY